MAKQLLEVRVDIPEGWEGTGEYRRAHKGNGYLYCGKAIVWTNDIGSTQEYFILRRVEPVRESRWRNVYPKDHSTYAYYYKSYEEARSSMPDEAKAEGGRIERVDFENGKPVHVALEPAEGEGAKCVACHKPVCVGPLCRDCIDEGSTP